jgi:hypothetical protein
MEDCFVVSLLAKSFFILYLVQSSFFILHSIILSFYHFIILSFLHTCQFGVKNKLAGVLYLSRWILLATNVKTNKK